MSQGKKRERITIERLKTDAENVTRTQSKKIDRSNPDNWKTLGKRWAAIEQPAQTEAESENQIRSSLTHEITVELDSLTRTIKPTNHRLLWTDHGTDLTLQISRATPIPPPSGGAKRDLMIIAHETE